MIHLFREAASVAACDVCDRLRFRNDVAEIKNKKESEEEGGNLLRDIQSLLLNI